MPKMKNNFFAEIIKADHQLSETFYFIKISYVLTELWIFFYLEWCFLSKKCHFQLKQLRYQTRNLLKNNRQACLLFFNRFLVWYLTAPLLQNSITKVTDKKTFNEEMTHRLCRKYTVVCFIKQKQIFSCQTLFFNSYTVCKWPQEQPLWGVLK